MRKKFTLFKTLLMVGLMLAGSGNAWADWTTVFTQNYEDEQTYALGWDNPNSRLVATQVAIGETHYLRVNGGDSNGATFTYSGLITPSIVGTNYASSNQYRIEFDMAIIPANAKSSSGAQTPVFTIYDKSNNSLCHWQVTTAARTSAANSTGSFYLGTVETSTFTSNTTPYFYHITINAQNGSATTMNVLDKTSNTSVDYTLSASFVYVGKLTYASGKTQGGVCLDDLSVNVYSESEIVPVPSAVISGVNGTDRTVTMALGTGSSDGTVIKYYTDTEEKSDLTTYSFPFTVSSTSTIYYYAESTSGATSDEQSINVTCEALTLNTPSISRSGNNITISDDQSNLDGAPTTTIYYTYNSNTPAVYSGAITVAADATIAAYSVAEGYTTSETATRAVALFPSQGIIQVEDATYKTFSSSTLTDESVTVSEREYAALKLDGTRWGEKVLLQTSGWGLRGNNTWYVAATNTSAYILMPNMKAGDIIVSDVDRAASNLVNATYSEKYSYGTRYAYIVTADGDVELGFQRVSSKINNYVRGFYAYSYDVKGTAVGAFDNTTSYLGATSDKVTLAPGSSYHYQFKNYNSGANANWNNFVLAAYDADDNVKVAVRADNFEAVEWKDNGCSNDFDWTDFVRKMNGATVDMTVSYSAGNVFSMNATITTNEDTPSTWNYSYASDYTGTGISLSGDIKVALSVDNSWLDIIASGDHTVSKTISAAGYATYCSPYPLDFTDTGLTAYIASMDGSTVKFTPVTSVPANTGVLLKGNAGNYDIAVAASSTDVSSNVLVGVTEDTSVTAGAFVLMNGDNGVGFYKTASKFTVGAYTAYLPALENGAQVRFIGFDGEDVTGIVAISAAEAAQGESYNVAGQRVGADYKGIVIKNGKKYLNK